VHNFQAEIRVKKEKLEEEAEAKMCIACLERDIAVCLVPFFHAVLCQACSGSISSCPMCRVAVQEVNHIYLG
jgi:hypothetical protein